MLHSLPPALDTVLQRELEPGERVVWQGQPAPTSLALTASQTALFGVPFFAFALFWTWGAGHQENGFRWFGYAWGSIFVLAGARMLLLPAWRFWLARRIAYVVTNRRALVVERQLHRTTIQRFSGELPTLGSSTDVLGRGSIVFDRIPAISGKGRTYYRDVGFFGLDDATSVIRLLPTTRRVASDRSSDLTSNERCN